MKGLLFGSLIAGLILVGCSDSVNVTSDSSSTGSIGSMSGGVTDSTENNNETMTDSSYDITNGVSIYFEFDRFSVDGKTMELIRKYAREIINNSYSIKLEGNADERGSDEYNYALALKRAAAVKDILASYGVNTSKIKLISYGESKPKCIEQTRECYRENRRVDLSIER